MSHRPDVLRPTPDADVAPIHYRIEPHDPDHHLWKVSVTVRDPVFPLRLSLPVWIPGSYLIREFARHVERVEARQRRKALVVTKVDKATWVCDGQRAAPVEVEWLVYAWDLSVRGSHLDRTHGFFNGTSVFLQVEGRTDERCTVDVCRPAATHRLGHWRVATTLRRPDGHAGIRAVVDGSDAHDGFGRFQADGYDELIDHPVEMGGFVLGDFEAGGCRHAVAVTGRVDLDMDRLCKDLRRICASQAALFEPRRQRAPVDDYLFLVTAVGQGYGGLEHRSSTALLCARTDLPAPAASPEDGEDGEDGDAGTGRAGVRDAGHHVRRSDDYVGFLELCSHEYFHTWNVKRIQPAAFQPYRLDRENLTRLLWIFEGFTAYYDDLTLVRCRRIDAARYVALLEKSVRAMLATPGHRAQSVAESSFDAWTKFYRPDEDTPNTVVSYYGKGSLVALCLDLTIRSRTRGRHSLDDVMRRLWKDHGRAGLPEDGFAAVVRKATGLDLSDEIAQWAYGTDALPLPRLLGLAGIEWTEQADADAAVDLGGRLSRGADPQGLPTLTHVWRDGAAARAGLAAGDVLVAIDGLRPDERTRRSVLAQRRPGQRSTVHAFRRDELIELSLQWQAPAPRIGLRLTKKAPALRRAWLDGTQ